MKLRLQSIEANKPIFEFVGSIVTIGRDAGCDLPMSGTSNVSGRHAQVTLTMDGAYLTDLESTNGTFLNDRRIEGRKNLRQGDYFRLGQTGPCFQVIELDLTNMVAAVVNVGTAREEAASPAPAAPRRAAMSPAKKPKPAPEAPAPMSTPPAASGQTRLMVVELQKKNRSLVMAIAAGVAALAVVLALAGIYILWTQHNLNSRTAELDDKHKSLQAKTEDLDQTVGKVASNVEKLSKSDEEEIFNKNADAVYKVEIGSDKKGFISGYGTAFAFDKNGKLATNGHITSPVIQALRARRECTVIAHGGKKIYPIIAAVSHPQYTGTYSPDVGILTIALPPGDQLPVAVELASDEDLRKLRPGVQLCYIGFPGWSKYDSLNKIEPHLYKGGLSRLVTFKEESGDFSNQYYLQHDMLTTRGSSGSPIFNRSGKVVAIHNSGNMVDLKDASGKMKTVSDGWKAGIRIDLLKQIMR